MDACHAMPCMHEWMDVELPGRQLKMHHESRPNEIPEHCGARLCDSCVVWRANCHTSATNVCNEALTTQYVGPAWLAEWTLL